MNIASCEFHFSAKLVDGVVVIEVTGRVTPRDFILFKDLFIKECERHVCDVVVDLTRAEYVCTSCWALFLKTRELLEDTSDRMVLAIRPGTITKVMKTLGFDKNFEVFSEPGEAIRHLQEKT